MLRYIIDFDELYYGELPDKQTADDRREVMVATKKSLTGGEVERGSYASDVSTLDHYKEVFGDLYARMTREKNAIMHVKYLYCVSMLKQLTGRFRLGMLLHDLHEICDDLI